MQTVAIAGVGLIGGSLGLALRKAGFTGTILGVSSERTIAEALACGAIDHGVTLEQAAADADVIYLAQPISGILSALDILSKIARPDCLITDAGSTKQQIMTRARSIPLFVGGHPMAGKEARGVRAADADLFRGRTYIWTLRSPEGLSNPHVQDFVGWMSRCGVNSIYVNAEEHDRLVSWTSHLPQLASTALAAALEAEITSNQQLMLSGPGLQDSVRLAGSSWDIWQDIVATNADYIKHALSVYIDKLTDLRDNLQTQRTGEEFMVASHFAARLRAAGVHVHNKGELSCE